jgi:hypothetical protein
MATRLCLETKAEEMATVKRIEITWTDGLKISLTNAEWKVLRLISKSGGAAMTDPQFFQMLRNLPKEPRKLKVN